MKAISLTHKLSFKLAAIFIITLFVSCICVGSVVYYSLTDTIRRTELSAIEDRATEYQYAYSTGGLPGLISLIDFHHTQNPGQKIFVRIEGKDGILFENTFSSKKLLERRFDPGWNIQLNDDGGDSFIRKIRSFVLEKEWTPLLQFFNFEVIYVFRKQLADGIWINTGHSLKVSEREFLRVRMLSLQLIFLFLLVGGTLAYALSRTVISPVRQMMKTIRQIESGNSRARINVSGSVDEFNHLSNSFNMLMDSNSDHIENLNGTLDTIAHEIRTPLTRFQVEAELALSEKNDSPKVKEALYEGLEASEKISHLLTTVLESSRIQSGQVQLKKSTFNLSDLCHEIADIYHFLLEEKQIRLELSVPSDLFMTADRLLILQALNNLVDNAIKYSPSNSTVIVSASESNSSIIISVSDEGKGIDKDEHGKIWERLYRATNAGTEKGFGIGLSFVKQVAILHGGNAEVSSVLGNGSRFSLRIPSQSSFCSLSSFMYIPTKLKSS